MTRFLNFRTDHFSMNTSWLNGFHLRERFPEGGTLSRVVHVLAMSPALPPLMDTLCQE